MRAYNSDAIYTAREEEIMTTAAKGALALSICMCVAVLSGPSYAYDNVLRGSASRHTQTSGTKQFFQEHPKVRSAAIGAGVGTAAGAVTGLVTGKGVVRGAAIGAGAGAGVGLIRSSNTLNRHPIIKDVATGTAVGLRFGLAGRL